ncbi:MAG: cobyrinate a,c-diamide synthase [Clostridia bacterium]
MLAGTGSGCGKTTCALALMGAARARGLVVAPFKSGPDYIDPGFHRAVCARPSHNLDQHLTAPDGIFQILTLGMKGADIGVIEGAMGYYDGRAGTDVGAGADGAGIGAGTAAGADCAGERESAYPCSAYALARATGTPVILVVDGAGSAASAAAVALGFDRMVPRSGLCGVLVNRASSRAHYEAIKRAVERVSGLACVGYMPRDARLNLHSRHLGLIPASEVEALADTLALAAQLIEIDWPLVEKLARGARAIEAQPPDFGHALRGYRLGVARDAAFDFLYEANLEVLRRMGAQLVFFSPLDDRALPEGIDGLYLPGGFPEVFEERLMGNREMCASVNARLSAGLSCYAECGGLLYLAMIGFLPLEVRMTPKLQRFGYVQVEDASGLRAPAHEFHHSLVVEKAPIPTAFTVRKGEKTWRCGYQKENTLAGYPHLHFWSHPEWVERLWRQ